MQTKSTYSQPGCTEQQKQLTTELADLTDSELQELGIWRNVIPTMVEELLAKRGCTISESSGIRIL